MTKELSKMTHEEKVEVFKKRFNQPNNFSSQRRGETVDDVVGDDEQSNEVTEVAESNVSTLTTKRTTPKQRRDQMDGYRQTFLIPPKIVDRQTVFISRELRDELDLIVRRLGGRKMSVSGFVQNVICDHLAQYAEDIEYWRKM